MTKVIAIIILIVVAIAAGYLILQQSASADPSCLDENSTPLSFTVGSKIPLSAVQQNNTIKSCFVIYENKVYRIPASWICEHPGGRSEIESMCGQDVTEIFNQGQHDSEAGKQLDTYYVGDLVAR